MTLQEAKPLTPGLRNAVIDGDVVRYCPVAGTHGWRDGWCMSSTSLFATMMAQQLFSKIVDKRNLPFRWSTDLNGLKFWARNSDWEAGADALYYFLEGVPYRDRNVIAHSHGGQVAIIAAAQGLQLRSLTTVGTPVRADVPALDALGNIGFWQHIFDKRWDLVQLFGQSGDREFDYRRQFNLPGVVNFGLRGISHSNVLRDSVYISMWAGQGWLRNIRESRSCRPDPAAA